MNNDYKKLLEEANAELNRTYDRLYSAQDEIKELETIIDSKSFTIYAILIANDCSYHRLIENSKKELVCIDCGLIYCVTEIKPKLPSINESSSICP